MPEEKSLRDELADALDSGDTNAELPAKAEAAEPVTQAEEPAADRTRDEKGRFLGKQADAKQEQEATADAQQAPVQPAAQQAEQAQQQQPGVDLPPSTWTVAAKAEYAKLPEVVRAEIKKRERDMQQGITQYKAAAEFGSKLSEVVKPYEPMIRAKGGSVDGVISNLLSTAYALNTGTPQERGALLMKAAEQYGADLSPWLNKGQQQAAQGNGIDPNALAPIVQQLLQPHLQRIEQFQGQFTTAQQQREQAEQQEHARRIEAFRSATDEKGQAKHVYFDNVRGLMASFIESGNATSLEQAYEMACRAHPEVSQQLAANQRQAEEARRLGEQRRLAEDAKRANTANASGQGGVGIAGTSKLSLRDELAAQLEGARIS